MTSLRHLKIVSGAGEPDDVPAKRIDLVNAAVRFYDAVIVGTDLEEVDNSEIALFTAARRYKAAVKRRLKARTS